MTRVNEIVKKQLFYCFSPDSDFYIPLEVLLQLTVHQAYRNKPVEFAKETKEKRFSDRYLRDVICKLRS